MKSKVTIIITSYNQWDFLIEAIRSVLSNNLEYYCLIICDDASRKEEFEREKIEYFINSNKTQNLESYLILINDSNIGLVKSINRSLQNVETKYVFFLDGDDQIPPTILSQMIYFNEREKFEILGGLTAVLSNPIIPVEDYQLIIKRLRLKGVDLFVDIAKGSLPFRFSGALIDYNRLSGIGNLDDKFDLYQDRPALLKLALNGFRFGIFNGISYYYRPHEDSMTTGNKKTNTRLLNDQIILFNEIYSDHKNLLGSDWVLNTTAKLKFIKGYRENKSSPLMLLKYLWVSRDFILRYLNFRSLKNFIAREL
jgi:glycosyltransferase involved in cell wall biosynthesis